MYRVIEHSKATCKVCGKTGEDISGYLKVCKDCIKEGSEKAKELIFKTHKKAREKIGLPAMPLKDPKGVKCNFCGNECQIGEGGVGYCGLSKNVKGKLVRELGTSEIGLIYAYKDPHPTNCVAAWYCAGGTGAGYPKYSKSKEGPEYGFLNASLFLGACCFYYSLLAFYPCYLMSDVGFTSKKFAEECFQIAKKTSLKKVRIGNLHLLR